VPPARPPLRPRAGLSLIEILVTLGIVAALAALLTPALTQMQLKARTAQCLSNMHQAGIAILSYAKDNDGGLPTQKTDNLTIYDPNGWVGQIRTYLNDRWTVLLCPESSATRKSVSYVYNGFASTARAQGAPLNVVKLQMLEHPSRDILLVDQLSSFKTEGYGSYLAAMVEQPDLWWGYPHPYGGQRYGARSVLFADGHVTLAPKGTLRGSQMYWPPELPPEQP